MKKLSLAVALLALMVIPVASAHPGHGTTGQRIVGEGTALWGLQALVEGSRMAAPVAAGAAADPVTLQFLNVSDWHGQLDPVSGVGGASVISAYWKQDRLANPRTLTLTAGDAVGATPPLSASFQDEPAIKALRLMGVEVDTFGNHNFDAGLGRLQAQINLARNPSVPGSPIAYVSANLDKVYQALNGVSALSTFRVGGVKVAVIGLTNPEAPTLVFPGSFGPIVPTDPYAAAKKARQKAKQEGAKVFLLIPHMGVTGIDPVTGAPSGPLVDLANNVSGFNVIFGDHTDVQYQGVINGQLVLENRSKGATYARTSLTVDRRNGSLISQGVEFITPLAANVTPDAAIEEMLAPYRTALAPILSVGTGSSGVAVPRADSCGNTAGRICESLVGDLATDSMRTTYLTDFAITNSGGLRADLTCPTVDSATDFCPAFVPPPYPITRGQVFGVLPFGNVVATLSIGGDELKTFLENGVSQMPAVNGRFAQVSGLCFTYDITAVAGSRVTSVVRQAADGSCTGAAVDLTSASSYSLAINDFMASGGDSYPNVKSRSVTRGVMDEVLAAYLTANAPVSPSIQGRIVCTGVGCPVALP